MSLAEQITNLRRGNKTPQAEEPIFSGIIVGFNPPRYLVDDGNHTLEVESGVSEQLALNDRVWCARGRGMAVIIGTTGTNRETGT